MHESFVSPLNSNAYSQIYISLRKEAPASDVCCHWRTQTQTDKTSNAIPTSLIQHPHPRLLPITSSPRDSTSATHTLNVRLLSSLHSQHPTTPNNPSSCQNKNILTHLSPYQNNPQLPLNQHTHQNVTPTSPSRSQSSYLAHIQRCDQAAPLNLRPQRDLPHLQRKDHANRQRYHAARPLLLQLAIRTPRRPLRRLAPAVLGYGNGAAQGRRGVRHRQMGAHGAPHAGAAQGIRHDSVL